MAAKNLEIYKCKHCGIITEITHGGGGSLICCGEPMTLMKENTTDAAQEKHVPVVEKIDNGVKVTVGSVAHPMEEKHWIEWIEVIDGNGIAYRKFLSPGEAPEATFPVPADGLSVREYCNVHGLWKTG